MAMGILVIGESGSGKTTSCRTLDPKTTYYIDADRKGLCWKGWKKQYNEANGNYLAVSKPDEVYDRVRLINDKDARIKTIVIDTLNGIMVDQEFRRMHEKNYDKWADLAWSIYKLIGVIGNMRDDLNIVCMAHAQTDHDENGFLFTRMKTSGRKLDKIVPESKFTTVLLAKASDGRYVFETHANHSTAKSPLGAFPEVEIPNDMKAVIDTLRKYGED